MRASVRIVDSSSTVIADIGYTKIKSRAAFLEPGGWHVDTPFSERLLDILESRTVAYWVLIVDHGVTGSVHGGRLTDVEWDGALNGVITLSGIDGNADIHSSNTLPDPALPAYPVGSTPRADYTYGKPVQQASRSIYELVDDQLNAFSPSYRQRPVSLTLANLINLGRSVALFCRSPFEPLLDTVRDWSLDGGVVTDFPLKGASAQYEMRMRVPAEAGFRLSADNGTPIRWRYRDTAGTLHIVNAGGKGEGVDRPVAVIAGAADPRWDITVQRFVKASSATTQNDLNNAGLKALEGKAAARGVTARAVTSRMGVQFRQDYELGDIVSVVFAGVEYRQLITAVETEWGPSGKLEEVETGEPPIFGVTLGRQAPVAPVRPTAGLSAGDLALTSVYTYPDSAIRLAFEIVYARGEAIVQDQATWAIEQRIDGGAWTTAKSVEALGTADVYYVDKPALLTAPAYVFTLEYRGVLAQTGETTVYSPVLLLESGNVAPGAPSGLNAVLRLAGDTYAADLTWGVPIDAGQPAADSLDIRYRIVGAPSWTQVADATDPAGGATSISHNYTPGETYEYQIRFVSSLFDGPWSSSATLTYPSPPVIVSRPTTTRAEAGSPIEWTPSVVTGNPTPTRTRYRIGMGSTPDGLGGYTFVADNVPFIPTVDDIGKGIIVVENWENEAGTVEANELVRLGGALPIQVTAAQTGTYFTTGDGGYFTTGDGGYFTTE